MDEFIVQLLAQLDTSKVIKDYNKLKEKLEKQISIKVSLDTSDQKDISKLAEQLQTALSKVSNGKINLDTSQITSALEQVIKNAQQTGKQVANTSTSSTATIIQNEEKKQQAYKQTAQAQTSANNQNIDLSDNTKKIEQFKQSLAELGTVDSKYVDKLSDRFGKLDIQIQSINASLSEVAVHEKGEYMGTKEILSSTLQGIDKYGQAITLTEQWDLTNHEFVKSLDAVGASFQEIQKHATIYQTKLNDLKTKYSNANVDYSGFEKVLSNFQKGIGTVDDLKLAFNQLENSAKLGVQSLKSQSSSFDPIQQALNNMRDIPPMLEALKTNMEGVKDKTSLAGISVEDLTTKHNTLKSEMDKNNGKIPLTEEWTTAYRELMSTVVSATKQVEALKKAEASDNSQATKQANYYSTILSNYREIYSLKKKLITTGEEETKVIKEQIRYLSSSNASIYRQLNKQGLKDSSWQTQVNDLKEELNYSLRISEAHQKDKTTQSNLNNAQKESVQIIKDLEVAYQNVQDIKVKISSLDKDKDSSKISSLVQEQTKAQEEYEALYNRLRKRKNYDKESWNETKSAIDAATKSQIEFNNAKSQDTLNNSQKTELTNFNILKSEWEEQGILVGEFKNKVEAMEASLSSVGNKGELDNLKLQIKDLKSEASTISQVNKIQLSIDTGGYESKVETLISKTQQWTDEFGNAQINTDQLSKSLELLNTASKEYSNNPSVETAKALTDAETQLDVQVKKVTNSISLMNSTTMKSSAVDSLRQKYQEFYDKNGAAHRQWGTQLKQAMLELASGAEISKIRGEELKQELIQIQNAARQAGKLGKSGLQKIFEGFKSFGYWTSSTFIFMKAIQSIKGGISTVKGLDTALVDLKKTTTMTASELEDFYYASNKVAKQMGVTTEEIINQASAWSRLGYSSNETATKMAKYSSMFASISPGMDIDAATDGLVSIMKAYDIGNSNPDEVLDGILSKINIIGNTAATSNAEIVNMLSKSSSAMAEANNTLEETIALETAAVEITRDDDSVGNAFKTVSMRIRGYDEETQEFIGDVEELSGKIADLTKTASTPGGISLFTDDAKTEYKSTYQLLKEISEIYDQLTDKDQAGLLEALAGKRQGQIIAATINNFEATEKALDNMAKSAGSAEAEMSIIMDSLDYKLNRLSETSTSVAQNLFKRDDMKTVIDGLTSVMNVIDKLTSKLGLFGSIGLGAGLFAGWKNVGGLRFREFYLLMFC